MSLPLALTLCVGASQKSGQVLVRTYVLKHAEFPKVYWGMSGVLNLVYGDGGAGEGHSLPPLSNVET
jgi:hypothetical protein